jgi:hypothetical protein
LIKAININTMTSKIQTSAPEKTGQQQDCRFRPGRSGNPAGRPKGARSRLGEQFIQALADDFDEHGDAVIEVVRTKDPVAYIKVIKDTLPREVLVKAFTAHATIDLSAMEAAEGRLAAYKFARDFIGAPVVEAQPVEADEGAIVTEGWRGDD